MNPLDARAMAKKMFRELDAVPPNLRTPRGGRLEDRVEDNPAFFERAAVLADVVLQGDRPGDRVSWRDVGEALALAVRGRVTPYSARFAKLGVGAPVPPATEGTELSNALFQAKNILFAPRRPPCLPNPRELRELVYREHGDGREGQRELRRLNAALRETCGYSSYSTQHLERVMAIADEAIGGHGVERAAYEFDTRRGIERPVDFYYVNTGDTYNATLIANHKPGHRRFYISTWGDEVERAERRYGEGGMWRV